MSGCRVFGDWGSTRLRLWRVRDGTVQEERHGPGIVGLSQPPEEVLREALAPWRSDQPTRIRLCGMVGARGGLREAPYAECPLDPEAWRKASIDLDLDGIPLRIAAGMAVGGGSRRSDVMRGEETQVFGAIRARPELGRGRQTIVHPGTHSKWIDLAEGRIIGFRTFFTGELFAVLQRSSLLSLDNPGTGTNDEGFATGLALAKAERHLLGNLFQTRAAQVREGRGREWAKGFLSGLLIGSEVAEQSLARALPDKVVVMGEPMLTAIYVQALQGSGVVTETMDGDECVLAGLELLDADG